MNNKNGTAGALSYRGSGWTSVFIRSLATPKICRSPHLNSGADKTPNAAARLQNSQKKSVDSHVGSFKNGL